MIAHFAREGYGTLPDFLPPAELPGLQRLCEAILVERVEAAQAAGGFGWDGATTLWVRLRREEELILEALPLGPRLRQTAAALLGAAPADLRIGGRIFYKAPRVGRALPFHQDEAHRDPAFVHNSLNAFLALDPATPCSGGLRYLPGSHTQGIRTHVAIGGMQEAVGIPDVDPAGVVTPSLQPGAAAFHHCRLVHASGDNTADHPRRAFVFVCEAPPQRLATPLPRPWLAPSLSAAELQY